MKSARKPKDRFTPFYTLKWAKLPVPDPRTATEGELHLPATFVDREIFFKKGKEATLLRFSARMITFKRMVDAEGNVVWAYPMDLPRQNWRMN